MTEKSTQRRQIYLLLHNIRSAHNVGSIFRTADALGTLGIFLSGYTPAPTDRFGRPVKEIAKTALGAELTMPWEYAKQPDKFIKRMKKLSATIVGVEQDKRAVDYKTYVPSNITMIIVGNEVRGISKGLKQKCDTVIEIPMYGKKESLNVSVAFGVVLFRLFDR